MILLYFSIAISCIYGWLIISLIQAWEESSRNQIPENYIPQIGISVIIIARNEEENISDCLLSILANDFPKNQFEIIVVDDHSEDSTIETIQNIDADNIKVLSLESFTGSKKINAYKKAGIQYALQHAKFDYILHTDADCLVPENWIKQTAYNFEQGIKMQAGPIGFKPVSSFLEQFQQLDMYTLMASTNAGIKSKRWYLANGANLAYQHSSLPENIYQESDLFASGDDVFLINQMAEYQADKIHFEEGILVTTVPVNKLKDFIRQRVRWAGKNKNLSKGKMKNILLVPVLTNLWVLVLLALIPFYPKIAIICFSIFLFLKALVDYTLLNYMHDRLNAYNTFKGFPLGFLCYPVYITLIGIVSLVTKRYEWKSRRVH